MKTPHDKSKHIKPIFFGVFTSFEYNSSISQNCKLSSPKYRPEKETKKEKLEENRQGFPQKVSFPA